ncbi:MAG: TonB-dependent receptor plug domain-containing protein [bacterium]|nr:TonB-dependent receptor plug domain-containing protein [bacterium]
MGRRNWLACIKFPFRTIRLIGFVVWLFASSHAAHRLCAQETKDPSLLASDSLANLSLEELMNLQVTSVSKKPETLSTAAAAIFVITREDIRRSGVTSIADALRMVPGLDVARIDANKWAISARGFSDRFSNKLLVMIDGRSVYTTLFSGVFWDMQDLILEDVERIEVIRGPGAALWGANAVNGVINIITRHAKETQGGLITTQTGTEEQIGEARWGGQIGEDLYYRVFAKSFYRDDFKSVDGGDAADEWKAQQAGFRIDLDATLQDAIMLEGGLIAGGAGTTYLLAEPYPPYTVRRDENDSFFNANLLARWTHTYSDDSDFSLQVYYDRFQRGMFIYDEDRDMADLDFQHRFSPMENHELIWGLGYRLNSDSIRDGFNAQFDPDDRTTNLFSAFVQDDITLTPDRLFFNLGSKFEHNDYSGFEVQPSARLSFVPVKDHTFWIAVSRAVRTPSRYEQDAQIHLHSYPPGTAENPLPLPLFFTPRGDESFDSEKELAYELGYRCAAASWITLDVAAFYNRYNDLLTAEPYPLEYYTDPTPYYLVPLRADNLLSGESYGVETAAEIQVTSWQRLRLAYSFEDVQLHRDSKSEGFIFEGFEKRNPRHQVSLRSMMDLTRSLELDAWFRWVDELPGVVSGYATMDVRLGWRPDDNLELSAGVMNSFDPSHQEFVSTLVDMVPSEVERSFYLKATWRF